MSNPYREMTAVVYKPRPCRNWARCGEGIRAQPSRALLRCRGSVQNTPESQIFVSGARHVRPIILTRLSLAATRGNKTVSLLQGEAWLTSARTANGTR